MMEEGIESLSLNPDTVVGRVVSCTRGDAASVSAAPAEQRVYALD